MTVNVTYREAGAVVPGATTIKNSPLSNGEIDGNFKSVKDAVEVLSTSAGAGLIGATPVGDVVATTVQAAIAELDSEKVSLSVLTDNSGSSLVGFEFAPIPSAINKIDWAIKSSQNGESILRWIAPSLWADIFGFTSASDVTAAFVTAAARGVQIYVPDGLYNVTHSNIVCADGAEFSGSGTLKDLSTPTVTAGNPNFGFIRITKNNKISGLKFIGQNNRLHAVVGQSSTAKGTVENIRVTGLSTTHCGVFITEPEQGFTFNRTDEAYVSWIISGPVTPDMIAKNIVVSQCTMDGDPTYTPSAGNTNSSQAHGIAFLFAEDCDSVNNHVSHARFGNWSFGGTPVAGNGNSVSGNACLNKNITFIGGSAKHVHSGHWMSRTENGVITGTACYDFKDVTLDFEGCIGCVASGNVTNDIGYGGGVMAALFGNKDVNFIGNVCTISGGASATMINSFIGNEDVSYRGNILVSRASSPAKVIIRNKKTALDPLSASASKKIYFDGNTLVNCDVLFEDIGEMSFNGNRGSTPTNVNAWRFYNCPDIETNDNKLNVTVDGALSGQSNSPVQLILSGITYKSVDVSRNKVLGISGDAGITIFGAQADTCVASVSGNRANTIFLDNSWVFGATGQNRGRVQFDRNIRPVPVDVYHIGASTLKSISGSESTNMFETVSNGPPTVGTWKIGDKVWKQIPTAGATLGWICTAAGTPGTWKDMPNIAA